MPSSFSIIINRLDAARHGLVQSFGRSDAGTFPPITDGTSTPLTVRIVEPTRAAAPPWADADYRASGAALRVRLVALDQVQVAYSADFTLVGGTFGTFTGAFTPASDLLISAFVAQSAATFLFFQLVIEARPATAAAWTTIYAERVRVLASVAAGGARTGGATVTINGVTANTFTLEAAGTTATALTYRTLTSASASADRALVAFDRVLLDAGTASFTVTLPPGPAVGTPVELRDAGSTLTTHPVTVGRNGQLINGAATDAAMDRDGLAVLLVFEGGSVGWKPLDA